MATLKHSVKREEKDAQFPPGSRQLALRIDLLEAIQALNFALSALSRALRAETGFARVLGIPDGALSRSAAADIYARIEYDDAQEPKETRVCPGVLFVGKSALTLARAVNAAKDEVGACLRGLDKFPGHLSDGTPAPLSRRALEAMGRARLSRVQCMRQIVLVGSCPDRVGFTLGHQVHVQVMTKPLARKAIEDQEDSPERAHDLACLAALKDTTPLALLTPLPVHVRANLTWRPPGGKSRRLQKYLAMPLLILLPRPGQQPRIGLIPDPEMPAPRDATKRLDSLIEDQPYFRSLNIHRYKTGCKPKKVVSP